MDLSFMSKDQHQLMATLVQFLRLSWIAATLPIIIASIPIPKLNFLRQILLLFAKRGKITHSSSSSSQKFTVPQRFFLHFYVVASIWTMFMLVATWVYAYRMRGYVAWQGVFLLLLMEAHVLRRLFETIYVFNYSPSARMHIVGYFTGLFFYIAAPLSLCGDCALEVFYFSTNLVTEFIVRGKNQMPVPEIDFWLVLNPLARLGWKHWIGAAVFSWGWIHQYRCHKILGSLRDSRQAEEYVIPRGDWFEIVSSPHYLSEIVIYASFVVATGGSNLTIWLLFAFVVANLAFAAVETHSWYRRKFEDYPSRRFAIIPFIL
ncbi:polyprenol reductase 2 isoform X2 [Lathyrus oleraceus]|uniref:polyprenol reductase 2 isoform X2 n=1 Tax=Pisum sativum TaxID=3888 RepID=UPI0021D0F4AB|nr:polyprenol reductase 2-like isoform X2 [Pisum sativum]